MHVDKPKDQDLVGHAITKFHLTSSLTFLKTNIQETHFLSFSTGPSKSEISAHFALFSLKERARKLPWVFLLSPRVHTHQKKDKSLSYLLFDSFKATTTIKNSLPLSFLRVQHQKKEKLLTLFFLSHLWVQQQGKMFLSILLKLLYPTWS